MNFTRVLLTNLPFLKFCRNSLIVSACPSQFPTISFSFLSFASFVLYFLRIFASLSTAITHVIFSTRSFVLQLLSSILQFIHHNISRSYFIIFDTNYYFHGKIIYQCLNHKILQSFFLWIKPEFTKIMKSIFNKFQK